VSGFALLLWSLIVLGVGAALGYWVRRPVDLRIGAVHVTVDEAMIAAWVAKHGMRLVHEDDIVIPHPAHAERRPN